MTFDCKRPFPIVFPRKERKKVKQEDKKVVVENLEELSFASLGGSSSSFRGHLKKASRLLRRRDRLLRRRDNKQRKRHGKKKIY